MMLWRRSHLGFVNPAELRVCCKSLRRKGKPGLKCWLVSENPCVAFSRLKDKSKLKEWEEINLKI